MTNNKSMNPEILYNWLFHYNRHSGKWHGFTRDEYTAHFNGVAKHNVTGKTIEDCMRQATIKEMELRQQSARLRDK